MRIKTNSRLLAQLPALCWTTDTELVLTSSFGALLDRIGTRQGTLTGTHIAQIFIGEQWDSAENAHKHALSGEEAAFDFQWYGHAMHAQLSPLFSSKGDIDGVIAVAVDATSGARLEEELHKAQAALATAEYIAHLGSWSHNYRTNEVWWSDELYRILGISRAEHPRERNLWSFDHPDDAPLIALTYEHAMGQRMPYSIEHRIIRPDGEVRTVLEQGSFAFDHAGNRIHEIGTILDVTERAKAQATLAKVQSSFADAQRIAQMGTWDVDHRNGDVWWSPTLYEIHGIEPDYDLRVGELWKFDHPDDRDWVRQTIETARKLRKPYSIVYRMVRPDGSTRRILERGADFFDETGARIRNIGIIIDLTDEPDLSPSGWQI